MQAQEVWTMFKGEKDKPRVVEKQSVIEMRVERRASSDAKPRIGIRMDHRRGNRSPVRLKFGVLISRGQTWG